MKPTAAKTRKALLLTGALAALLFPASVFASVAITEIMYDVPGSDSGREWIEIADTGTAAVDTYGYKLFEDGVNHNLTIVAGTSTLAAGEAAVISNNTEKFLEDFPNYTGTLFKSSFSLSNTAATLVLKDSKLVPAVSVTYNSGMGAAGDGNSLHPTGDTWIPGAPNPGSLAATAAIKPAPAAVVPTSKGTPSKSSSATKTFASSYTSTSNLSDESTAAGVAAVPFQPPAFAGGDTFWASMLGLAALVVIGVGGSLYIRSPGVSAISGAETTPTAEEFDIE